MAHLHMLGICGTFMGSLALLARELGHRVTGSDENIYPPMSTLLAEQGVEVTPGYDPGHLVPAPDLVVVGNAMTRGNPAIEAMLDRQLRYTSGPAWLRDHVLSGRSVVAVAGTHGKTTTASALAWILEQAGRNPGFLIGGVPTNFGVSARNGGGQLFVVEADEYDTAFFDKRSKFVHYRPQVAVLNNLEFDHADIFDDIGDIRRQFHHFVRTVPGRGTLVVNGEDPELETVLAMGSWTPIQRFYCSTRPTVEGDWEAESRSADHSSFTVRFRGGEVGETNWPLIGRHNMANALACVAAAHACGVSPAQACAALQSYAPVKRRLETIGEAAGVRVIHDFAHHPTAIAATLEALRANRPGHRLLAAVDPRSNTMKMGAQHKRLGDAFAAADRVYFYRNPELQWSPDGLRSNTVSVHSTVQSIVEALAGTVRPGDCVVVMSNGHFEDLPALLLRRLRGDMPRAGIAV